MKLTKRAISLLLTLLMVVGCLSGLSLTASADYYAVWVLGTHVTDSNKNDVLGDGGSVRYNPTLGILYLTNAGVLNGQTQNYGGAVIYAAAGNLTIELSGTTTVQAANYGILTTKDLSIHGDGKLIAYGNESAINVFGTLYLDDEDSDPTVVAQGAAYGIKANSAVLLHGNLTAQTSGGGGTSGAVPNAGLYVTGGKLELGSSDPRVFRNNLNLTLLGNDSLPVPDGSPALYAAGGIEISSCLNVTAPQDYQLSSDHCRLLTSSGENATNITVQPKQYYRIQLTGDGGTVTSDQPGDLAFPGQRVTLSLAPDEGCSLVDLVCLDGDGDPLALTNTGSVYSFLMPENSAEVYALFSDDPDLATYAVDMDASIENGVVIPDYNRQTEGEPVTLTVVPDAGYQLTDISVSAGGNDVPLTQDGSDYTFTMPASDVTVHATFEMVGGLYVCGVEVTSANAADILGDGTASYNFETHTLTVNNLPQNGNLHERAVVWTLMPELTVTGSGYVYSTRDGAYYGIFAENADLTLSGDLTVLGGIDGVKAKSLRVSDVGTEISINGAHISGKVTVRNSVKELFFSGNLYCEELVLGDLEYIASPAGGTASSVINTNVGMIDILHHERHTITVTDSFYGTVTADKTEAFPGETIQLTATADAGCAFDSWTVKDANNNTVTVTSNQFTMPDSDVTVTANFHMNAPTTTESYDLYIGNTQVTSSNCMGFTPGYSSGTVRYNPASHTLYFENFTAPEFKNGWLSGNGIIMTHSLDLTLVGTGDISRNMADYSIEAPDNNVTVRGNFQFRSIHAQNVTFDGGSSTVRTYHGVALPVSGVVTVTNNNERLYLEDSYYGGYNYQVTLTTGTFALGDLQLITQGGPTVEALSQTSSNHDAEIRRRPENTVTVEEAVGGRVTASSRTAYETHYVDLTIEPEDGYALQSLTVTDANGDPVDVTVSGSSATFRMPASAVTVTPVFMRGYAVRVASATHGSVTAEKISYGIGETVMLTVSPAGGYELNELTVFAANGRPVVLTQDPTDQSVYTFPMPGCDVTVAARFARSRYTVNVSKSGNGSYTISDTVARFGDTVTLTTTTEPGYSVESVTVNNSDTEVTQDGNSYSFIMPAANVTVTVRFVHTLHTVTVEETEHGTVTADKAGAYYGDTVTLTVTPDRSYLCTGLALLYDGSSHPLTLSGNTCSFTMPDANVSVAASFTSPDFRININAEHGTVSASPNPAKYTDTVTLTATPDTGYRLTGLLVDDVSLVDGTGSYVVPALTYLRGSAEGTDNGKTRMLLDGDVNTKWFSSMSDYPYIIFKADSAFRLTGYTLTTGADTASYGRRNWQDWTIYGANFASDEEAVLNSADWQTVVSVKGDTTMQAVNCTPYTFTLDEAASSYQYYKIVIHKTRPNTQSGLPYPNGYDMQMAELSMHGFTGTLPQPASSSSFTFTMPAADVTVTPTFTAIDYEITADAPAHAVVTVPETARYGDRVQPTATVDEGWSLLGFTVTDEDGTVLPTYADNSFDMPAKNVTVTPRLGAASYTIAVLPVEHGTVTVNKTVASCGEEITFTVAPADGYALERLTVLNFSYEVVYQSGPANEYTFTMPAANLMVTAKFAQGYGIITQSEGPGTVVTDLTVAQAGALVTIEERPEPGCALAVLTVVDALGNPIPVENMQFTMPASAVIVTASFNTAYTVTIDDGIENGTVTSDKAIAAVGSTVTLTVTPGECYALDSVTVNVPVTPALTYLSGSRENGGNGDSSMLLDGDVNTKWVQNVSSSPYIIFKADQAFCLTDYTLTTAADTASFGGRNWKDWTIYGANFASDEDAVLNSADWQPVVTVRGDETMGAFDCKDYEFTLNGAAPAYQYYKIVITASRGGSDIQMSRLSMHGLVKTAVPTSSGSGVTFPMPESDVTVSATFAKVKYAVTVTPATNGTVTADKAIAAVGSTVTLTVTPGECYALDSVTVNVPVTPALTYLRGSREDGGNGDSSMLLDGDVNTKWVQNVSSSPYIIFKADQAFCLTDYTLTTAADTASFGGRNWKDWTIYGANFASDEDAVLNSADWQPVVTVTNDTTMQAVNGEDYTFTLNEAAPAYQYYKIVITASRGNSDIQMSRLSMHGLVRTETQPASGGDVTFTMPEADVIVSASFAKVRFDITVTQPANGTVTADKAVARGGETVTLTVTPDEYYALDSLTVGTPVTPALTYLRGSREDGGNGDSSMLLDGDVNTKWVQNVSSSPYIIFKADRAFCLTDYTLTTAADTASYGNRNWKDWTIYGANFASDEDAVLDSADWQPVVTVRGDDTLGAFDCKDYLFTLDGAGSPYQYYKLVITASRGDRDIQMSRLSMHGLVRTETQPASGGDVTFTMPEANVIVTAAFINPTGTIPYVDALGNAMTPVATSRIGENTTELTEGWWAVSGNITNNNRLNVSGAVNLILTDGATLTIPSGICVSRGNSLTVWAQSHGDNCGKLVAILEDSYSKSRNAAIGGNANETLGTVVINGGDITATGGYQSAGIGLGNFGAPSRDQADGTIEIHNGIVTATGRKYAAGIGGGAVGSYGYWGDLDKITITGGVVTAISGGYGAAGIGGGGHYYGGNNTGGCVNTITITGGRVTATSSGEYYGIGPGVDVESNGTKHGTVGSVVFGWTNADDDFIQSSKNVSADKIHFVDGKAFYIDGDPLVDATTDNIQDACKLIPKVDTYHVTVGSIENGTVTSDKATAAAGETVTLTVTPDAGYELGTLTVKDASNNAVAVSSGCTFTMPASDVTVSATFTAIPVSYTYFVGNSLTLEGDIGVNFYVKLNDVAPANARVVFTWGSGSKAGTQSAALADLTADANGLYKLTVRVAAAQMTDTITAELYDGETPVATQQYSVAKYARYVLGATDAQLLPLVENNADKVTSLRNLCKAMLIYGGKSQQQFKYNTYAPADQNLDYTLENVGTLGTTTFPEGFEDTCGIQFYAASLILESKTTYRLYFIVTDQAKLDALGMEYGTSGSYVYFDIANISATEVFKDHSMSFGGLTVTANAGTYATAVLSGENETLKDVVKALYWYSDAAKTFFGVQ